MNLIVTNFTRKHGISIKPQSRSGLASLYSPVRLGNRSVESPDGLGGAEGECRIYR